MCLVGKLLKIYILGKFLLSVLLIRCKSVILCHFFVEYALYLLGGFLGIVDLGQVFVWVILDRRKLFVPLLFLVEKVSLLDQKNLDGMFYG